MRVGIVTQPLEMNYGGILQNWALQQVLKRLGHDPITIDAYQRYGGLHVVYRNIANFYNWIIRRHCKGRFYLHLPYQGAVRQEFTGKFIENYIDKTDVMREYKHDVVQRYGLDAIVVGSDQVWRLDYNSDHIEDMFLHFAKFQNVKRIVYAASFGVDEWQFSPKQTAACAELAKTFDAVSVREASGLSLCKEYLGVNAKCVLDPTMLLPSAAYRSLLIGIDLKKEHYLAVYCLDITPDKKLFFEQLANDRGLVVRYFTTGWQSKFTVEQWLLMIEHASMVVTDSFHGTVFSILFGKEFFTMGNPLRGNTRISGLLEQLGLEGRLISDTEPVEPADCVINWQDVYSRLDVKRKESIEFLENALKE